MAVVLAEKPAKRKRKRIVPVVIVGFILAAAALLTGWKAWALYGNYQAARNEYQSLEDAHTRIDLDQIGGWRPQEQKPDPVQEEDPDPRVTGKAGVDFPDLGVDHAGLYAINHDYMGWLYIDDEIADIHISYPFVQGETNSEYLKTTLEGEKNAAGAVFADFNTPGDFSSHHTILYGHNMLDGSMFSSLKRYRGTSEKNPERYFYIYLRDGSVLKCRLFSTHVISKNSTAYQIDMSDKLYDEFFERIVSESEDDWGAGDLIPDAIPEKSVLLSTCHGRSGTSKRMAVHAYVDTWFVDPDAVTANIETESEADADAELDSGSDTGTGDPGYGTIPADRPDS